MSLSHCDPLGPKSKIYRLFPEPILNFFSSKHGVPEIRNFEGVTNTRENMIKAKNPLSALDLRGSGTPDCVPWPQLQMSGVSVWASGIPRSASLRAMRPALHRMLLGLDVSP